MLIQAGIDATVGGFNANGDTNAGDKLFDTVFDGSNTTSENMSRSDDGLNLRLYRVPGAYYPQIAQGIFTPLYIVPICFCPTFGMMKDPEIGQESIDKWRERLRLRTLAIYNSKNFKNYRAPQGNQNNVPNNNLFWPTPLQDQGRVSVEIRNIIYQFERSKPISDGDNWYSAPFTLWFNVWVANII